MAWTTPPTIVAGTVATAAEGNAWSNDLDLLAAAVSLYAPSTPLSGSLPSSNSGSFQIAAGSPTLSFSSGFSPTITFAVAFANGLLALVATPVFVGTALDLTMNVTGFGTTGFSLGAQANDSVFTGSLQVSYIAIGF